MQMFWSPQGRWFACQVSLSFCMPPLLSLQTFSGLLASSVLVLFMFLTSQLAHICNVTPPLGNFNARQFPEKFVWV